MAQPRKKSTPNRTVQRKAQRLARTTDLTYQQALTVIADGRIVDTASPATNIAAAFAAQRERITPQFLAAVLSHGVRLDIRLEGAVARDHRWIARLLDEFGDDVFYETAQLWARDEGARVNVIARSGEDATAVICAPTLGLALIEAVAHVVEQRFPGPEDPDILYYEGTGPDMATDDEAGDQSQPLDLPPAPTQPNPDLLLAHIGELVTLFDTDPRLRSDPERVSRAKALVSAAVIEPDTFAALCDVCPFQDTLAGRVWAEIRLQAAKALASWGGRVEISLRQYWNDGSEIIDSVITDRLSEVREAARAFASDLAERADVSIEQANASIDRLDVGPFGANEGWRETEAFKLTDPDDSEADGRVYIMIEPVDVTGVPWDDRLRSQPLPQL